MLVLVHDLLVFAPYCNPAAASLWNAATSDKQGIIGLSERFIGLTNCGRWEHPAGICLHRFTAKEEAMRNIAMR